MFRSLRIPGSLRSSRLLYFRRGRPVDRRRVEVSVALWSQGHQVFGIHLVHSDLAFDLSRDVKKSACALAGPRRTLVLTTFQEPIKMKVITTENQSTIFRTVDYAERSFALGIQWILVRVIGTIPAPVLFGWMFDVSCTHSQKDACSGEVGRSLVFISWSLIFHVFHSWSLVFGLWYVKLFSRFWGKY